MQPARVRTTQLIGIAAAIELAIGITIYALPNGFSSDTYLFLRPAAPALSPYLMAGGIILLILNQFRLPLWARRGLFVLPAIPLVVLAYLLTAGNGWASSVLHGGLALALAAVPWLSAEEPDDQPIGVPHLFAITLGMVEIVVGGLMLVLPADSFNAHYASLKPFLPLAGAVGLLGGLALILPLSGGRWASPFTSAWRFAGALLPILLFYSLARNGGWSGAIMWGICAAALFPRESALIRGRTPALTNDQGDPYSAKMERILHIWMWCVALLVTAIAAMGEESAVTSPLLADIFVLGISGYGAVMHWVLPYVGTHERRIVWHLSFLALATGPLLIDAGRIGHGMLVVLALAPTIATRFTGTGAGFWVLALSLVVTALGNLGGWLVNDLPAARVWGELTVEIFMLVAAAAVGMNSAILQSRRVAQLQETHDRVLRRNAILELTPDMVGIANRSGHWVYLNRAGRQISGLAEGESPRGNISPDYPEWAAILIKEVALPTAEQDGLWSGESAYIGRDGLEIPVSQIVIAHKSKEGELQFFSTVARDIREQKHVEAKLIHLANFDPLTDLFNRHRFNSELEQHLIGTHGEGHVGAVLFLDLDRFKYINDSYGHQAGDQLLQSMAAVLRRMVRAGDTIARLGGDEFGVLLPRTVPGEAQKIAKSILAAVRRHVQWFHGQPTGITASIGIALFPEQGTTAEELLARADLAMYQAKDQGRDGYAVYAPEMDQQSEMKSQLLWERRIRMALHEERFTLYCQPILDLCAGRSVQYELLVRMVSEDGQVILPEAFMSVAEHFGSIHLIDRWVVSQAIRLIAKFSRADINLCLEVNLSGKAFADSELLLIIRSELAQGYHIGRPVPVMELLTG